MYIPRLMVAAPSSGSGKSVISTALMTVFSRNGSVQGFKVGPDYIDPMYHTFATGRPSRNLDTWMLTPEQVKRIFVDASQSASMSIIEGVMGLFDGHGANPFDSSSASIAVLLQCPIILVLDCAKISGSAAAIVHGMDTFSQQTRISGVICNRTGNQAHAAWLKEAIEKYTSVPVLGCLPRMPELQIPERHLGLFTVAERPSAARKFIEQAAEIILRYIDFDRLRKIANSAPPFTISEKEPECNSFPPPEIRLAVARDEAFCFYYEENLNELRRNGVEIIPFSPLTDTRLPEEISGVYFGGGYPELYARELASNQPLIQQIADYNRQDMPIYAECGGLMYLTQGIVSAEEEFPFVGIVPGWCKMSSRLTMGYREMMTNRDSLLGPAGLYMRGHEFHYSTWEFEDQLFGVFMIAPRIEDGQSQLVGYAKGNLLASYIHIHFSRDGQLARNFVNRCRDWKTISNNHGEK